MEEEVIIEGLPEGSIPIHSIRVSSFLDQTGEECYVITTSGSTSLSSSLGLLELAKLRLAFATEEDG